MMKKMSSAKIEEMEEQNYNIIDNTLNNGAGEKTGKEQEQPAGRISLKAHFAEKQALVSGQNKERQNQRRNGKRNGKKESGLFVTAVFRYILCL